MSSSEVVSDKRTYERRRTVLPVAGKADCVNFNVMVVGETGSGKTTFLRTLLKAEEAKATLNNNELLIDPVKRTVTIQEAGNFLLESIAGDVKFYLYDTPGYGDYINNSDSIAQIYQDLQSRHEGWLSVDAHKITNEERLRLDKRIHCCFYFIHPHRFKEIDREFIQRISEIVPIIPIISKSDCMTMDERKVFLTDVQQALIEIAESREMHVDDLIYDFQEPDPIYPEADIPSESDSASASETSKPRGTGIPRVPNIFAVICDVTYERQYPWGSCAIRDDNHSDFTRLQKLVFEAGLHIKGLRDMTQRKTIDFLDNRSAFRAQQLALEEEAKKEEEARLYEQKRLKELEESVVELQAQLIDTKGQIKLQADKSATTIAVLEEQVRVEREAKQAALVEAKARADDERKLTDSLLKAKEELHVANNHIAKLRSERDAEIRKAVAAATPPPLPSGLNPAIPPPGSAPSPSLPPAPPGGIPPIGISPSPLGIKPLPSASALSQSQYLSPKK